LNAAGMTIYTMQIITNIVPMCHNLFDLFVFPYRLPTVYCKRLKNIYAQTSPAKGSKLTPKIDKSKDFS